MSKGKFGLRQEDKMKGWRRLGLWVGICILLTSCATTPAPKIIDSKYTVIAPQWKFVIQFPQEGFTINEEFTRRPNYGFTNRQTGLNVTFNFERAMNCNDSESCRDYFANKLQAIFPEKKNWRRFQLFGMYVSENMDGPVTESFQAILRKMGREKELANFPIGLDMKTQHWNAHVVEKGIWLDVHLSKSNYQEVDRELFTNFLRSMVILYRKF